jgi:hypothetical protein
LEKAPTAGVEAHARAAHAAISTSGATRILSSGPRGKTVTGYANVEEEHGDVFRRTEDHALARRGRPP